DGLAGERRSLTRDGENRDTPGQGRGCFASKKVGSKQAGISRSSKQTRSPHPVPNTTHATPGYLPVGKNCPGWVNKAQTYGPLAQVFGSDEGRLTL
ncbi:MAG: hypothetical protein AAFV49_21215, partial [Pseudomonadota bacterium]